MNHWLVWIWQVLTVIGFGVVVFYIIGCIMHRNLVRCPKCTLDYVADEMTEEGICVWCRQHRWTD